jgi:hypothetical protein
VSRPGTVPAALAAVAAAALLLPGTAAALECPQATMRERIDAADAVFVGRLVSSQPTGQGERLYRFDVAQVVKGPVGAQIDVRAPVLVDASDHPVAAGTDVGVLADLDGAQFVTDSCAITHPGPLLAEADAPRGGAIKLAIGAVFLAAALGYSLWRLRRRPGPRRGAPA